MPKAKGSKRAAAAQREAVKRGDNVVVQPPIDLDTLRDPTYVPPCTEELSSSAVISNAVHTENLDTKKQHLVITHHIYTWNKH